MPQLVFGSCRVSGLGKPVVLESSSVFLVEPWPALTLAVRVEWVLDAAGLWMEWRALERAS
jgi:hypothetical protein